MNMSTGYNYVMVGQDFLIQLYDFTTSLFVNNLILIFSSSTRTEWPLASSELMLSTN